MQKMIAYCGLNCEKCDAYLATLHNDDGLREKTAKLWSEMNNASILPEQINCLGCRVDGPKTVYCNELCPIRKCAQKKDVETCGSCPEMDKCESIASILSNNSEARENLKG